MSFLDSQSISEIYESLKKQKQEKYGGLQIKAVKLGDRIGIDGLRETPTQDGPIAAYTRSRQEAMAFFRNFQLEPSRDVMSAIRTSDGYAYQSTYTDISIPQWWTKRTAAPQKQEETMKKFTEKQLADGQYETLERIETPKPGEAFDMNQLAVAAVLTMNAAVQVIQELQKKVETLEALVVSKAASEPDEPEFTLPKLGDSYNDVAA